MRIANDLRKQEILTNRSEQVKFLKDNYLNQQEELDKKKKHNKPVEV